MPSRHLFAAAHKVAAVAAVTLGITLAVPAAFAQAVTATAVTATPSTGLRDAHTVTVSAKGFSSGDTLVALQCSEPTLGQAVCNAEDAVVLTADAGGNARGSIVVHRSFAGSKLDGSAFGKVDCSIVERGCGIVVSNLSQTASAVTAISFQ
ncbi:MAG: hypothetical protein HOV96_13235 [Nonomuraea sp.]|nr:hypothetical protein [Nonomuraea sp.]NUP78500.1 hypothetical protein [Nonomuraea sp.]NUT43078.1 hypothetical protein [Thermoactinospora sp.]